MNGIFRTIREKQRKGNHITPLEEETAESHTCLNCTTQFKGEYCPRCGQKATTGRLKIRNTIENFLAMFTKMNRGVVHTIADLLFRPGFMMRDYLDGHRAEYASPLLLIFVVIALDLVLPYSSADKAIYPEQWTVMLADHPVSYWITKAWIWVWEDERRTPLFCGVLFTPAIWLTAKIVKAGKYKPNFAEAFHMMLYILSIVLFLELFNNQLRWIPGIGDTLNNICEQILAFAVFPFVAFFSVLDCFKLSWKQMLAFIIISPVVLYLCFNVLYLGMTLVLRLDLPQEIYKQIDLLYMTKG